MLWKVPITIATKGNPQAASLVLTEQSTTVTLEGVGESDWVLVSWGRGGERGKLSLMCSNKGSEAHLYNSMRTLYPSIYSSNRYLTMSVSSTLLHIQASYTFHVCR